VREMEGVKIGFLGAGVMANALINGIIQSGLVTADRIMASDPFSSSRLESLNIFPLFSLS
jgi:pyrroline-5-carboxylate reductase